jgi:hypothetical protein
MLSINVPYFIYFVHPPLDGFGALNLELLVPLKA